MALLRMVDSIDNDPGGDGEDGDGTVMVKMVLGMQQRSSFLRHLFSGAERGVQCYSATEKRRDDPEKKS